jgi:competence protein ComEC
MSRPLLHVWIAFAAGVLVEEGLPAPPVGALLGIAALLLGIAWFASHHGALLVGVAGVALGAGAGAVERAGYEATPLRVLVEGSSADRPVRLRGRAASDGAERADSLIVLVDVDSIERAGITQRARGRVRLSIGGTAPRPTIAQGDQLAAWARLRPPRGYRSPGARDAADGARRGRVHAWGTCKTALLLERQAPAGLAGPEVLAARLRAWARARFDALLPAGPERIIVRSMVLGDRGDLDAETLEAFRAAGTYHVLALSGAQVALVAALLLAGLKRAGAGPTAMALTIVPGVSFYAVVVGADVPVVRAAAMTSVLLVGRALDHRSDVANLLALCGLALLAERPPAAAEIGYQLSFIATLALVLLPGRLTPLLPRLPFGLAAALAASLAAQVALLPVIVATFHRLSPLAPLTNLVAVPLSGAVLLAGLATLSADVLLPWGAGVAAFVARWTAAGLLASARLAAAPSIDPRLPDPPWWGIALLAGALVALARGRAWRRCALPLGLGLLGLVLGAPGPQADGRLHVSLLDVGQGEAIVVRSPAGRVVVIDAGARYPSGHDLGEQVVAPFLWRLGARRLERLVLTHVHRDHVGGAAFLLRSFDVGVVWEPPFLIGDREAAPPTDAARRCVARGVREGWDGVDVRVLGPRGADVPRASANDRSLVLSVGFGAVRVLLSGDVEKAGERGLDLGRHLIVKVPHHGSRSSSSEDLVRRAAARVALVSCGANNAFGHPHAEVLERYEQHGARIHRTDREGSVSVSTDGRRIWIRSGIDGRRTRIL